MVHPPRKRQLAFEQLDNRIAMNGDMHPSASIAYEPLQTRDFAGHVEIRIASFAATFPSYAVVQHVVLIHPSNPPPPQTGHRMEQGLKNNTGMRTQAEGEFGHDERIIIPTHSVKTIGTDLAASNLPLVRSSLDSTRSSVDVTNFRIDRSQPEASSQTTGAVVSSLRELVAGNTIRSSSPAPLVDVSSAKSGIETSMNTSSTVWQLQSHVNREPIASASTHVSQPKSLESAKRSESTKLVENGMLAFSMREAAYRSTEIESYRGLNPRNANRNLRDLQLLQIAECNRLRTGSVDDSNRLPIPKGMIDIGGSIADISPHLSQSIVSRASNNPFEILQLFVGSTNMTETVGGLASQVPSAFKMTGTDFQSSESTELATKEESFLALAIGVVFAMAFRQSKVQRTRGNLFCVEKRQWIEKFGSRRYRRQ